MQLLLFKTKFILAVHLCVCMTESWFALSYALHFIALSRSHCCFVSRIRWLCQRAWAALFVFGSVAWLHCALSYLNQTGLGNSHIVKFQLIVIFISTKRSIKIMFIYFYCRAHIYSVFTVIINTILYGSNKIQC